MKWKYVKGFNQKYIVSEYGEVIDLNWKLCGQIRSIKPWISKKGYRLYSFWDGEKQVRKNAHRVVYEAFIGSVDNVILDHIDRNVNNNHYSNLRVCTLTQSNQNRGQKKKHGYKGVSKHRRKWVAQLKANGVTYRESYETEKEAALAYNKLAIEHHKEFAVINTI